MSLSRRTFLRGAGGLSLALPLLPSLSRGQNPNYPLRLIIFFSGNGTIRDSWLPTVNAGRVTTLSPILAPLERHRDKLMVVDGMEIPAANGQYQPRSGFHGHERGLGAVLTGRPLNTGSFEANSGYGTGISVDQFIAQRLGAESDLGVLPVGLLTRRNYSGWYNRDTMSYEGDSMPVFMQSDGSMLFNRIFGETAGDEEAYLATQARRRSVLDFVRDDLAGVERQLSAEDRLRLAQHHEAFRTLEQQLSDPPPTCDAPSLQSPTNWLDPDQADTIIDFQLRQTVRALACDRTRVVSMQFGAGLGAVSMDVVSPTIGGGWHSASHETDPINVDRMVQMNIFIAQQFARLLDELDAVEEGTGTLLDHSIVCWVNEHGDGNIHSYDHVPLVMAGGGHGFFKTRGAFEDVNGRSNNDLLVTLCHAFGMTDVNEFGLTGLNDGLLTQLIA